MSIYRLDHLFSPRRIAIVGATDRPRSAGHTVLANLRAQGFAGAINLVNPRRDSIEGLACVPTVLDLPAPPDLAIVVTPVEHVEDIVGDLVARQARTAAIISGAQARGAEAVANLRASVAAIARSGGMRVLGPDCLGVLNPHAGLCASWVSQPPKAGDLALISQSATIATSIVDWAIGRGLGFSGVVSLGDKADIDFGDLLDWFAADWRTRAILLHVDRITHPQKFLSAARAAARSKPVIVIRSGRFRDVQTEGSHAAALAKPDHVYSAAFRRAGLSQVDDLGELFDAAEMLSRTRPFDGRRLAIVSNSSGAGVLAADRLAGRCGTLASFSAATRDGLLALLPKGASVNNPLDVFGHADEARYRAGIDLLLADPGVDALLAVYAPTALGGASEIATAIAGAQAAHAKVKMRPKPLLLAWMGHDPESLGILDKARLPRWETPHDAVDGFMHMVAHSEAQADLMTAPPSLPSDFDPDADAVQHILAVSLARHRHVLGAAETVAILKAYGIETAQAIAAATPELAADAARLMLATHAAVVVKIASQDIPHKSDVGGVVLGLTTPEAVADAARAMIARVSDLRPDAVVDGVSVHGMMSRSGAVELICGLTEDATFGPVVVFGRGGTAVEVINDAAVALPPLDLKLARDLIARTRVHARLKGYRDRPPANLDALALLLVRLAQLSTDHPEIRDVDLNPVLCDETGVVVVDAKISIAPLDRARLPGANPRFAIRPYPKEWERWDVLKDGSRVFVRPIKPDDEAIYPEFFTEVTEEDLRLRFFSAVRDFSHAFIARLTQLDYRRAMAFGAFEDDTSRLLGVVRVHADANHHAGEYAILLRSNLKGRGLGWLLMKRMIEYARSEGLALVKGQVLRENKTMISMCQRLGFDVKDDPDEPGIVIVTLDLAETSTRP